VVLQVCGNELAKYSTATTGSLFTKVGLGKGSKSGSPSQATSSSPAISVCWQVVAKLFGMRTLFTTAKLQPHIDLQKNHPYSYCMV
jgi:hypothetical protein